MNRIFYFSGSGKTKRLAEFFEKELEISAENIIDTKDFSAETAVVLFPVYCQNLPDPIKYFLPKLDAKKVAFAATYGRKSYGNVIEDAAKLTKAEFIGGVCVPCGHSFLSEPDDFEFSSVVKFVERIKNPHKAFCEPSHKDFYADLIPAKRTRIGVKITRNDFCNNCGICETNCSMGAIKNGYTNKNCIRCLRCVTECPQKALEFKTLWFMKVYLTAKRKNEVKLYL